MFLFIVEGYGYLNFVFKERLERSAIILRVQVAIELTNDDVRACLEQNGSGIPDDTEITTPFVALCTASGWKISSCLLELSYRKRLPDYVQDTFKSLMVCY